MATSRPVTHPHVPRLGPVLLASLIAASLAHAQPAADEAPVPAPDKGIYNLFNPTPEELMRPLSTDRPDTTESPFTVDAGHFQLEMSFFDLAYGRSSQDDQPMRALSVAPMLIKCGVLDNLDVQLGIDPWSEEWNRDGTAGNGFGDMMLRVKLNLWGNDSFAEPGDTSFGIMPYATFPTADSNLDDDTHFAWGLIAPLSVKLPGGCQAGGMAELDFTPANDAIGASGTTVSLLTSATVSFPVPVIEDLSMFVEYAGTAALNGDAQYAGYFDTGFTFLTNPNTQWDGGIRVGVTDGADEFAFFAGLSLRW